MKTYQEVLKECLEYTEEQDREDFLFKLFDDQEISMEDFQSLRIHFLRLKENEKNNSIDNIEVGSNLMTISKIKIQGLKKLPPRNFIIKRFGIEEGTLTTLVSTGNSGKTLFLQYLACCVSEGFPIFGQIPVIKGSILHIDEEQSETQTQRRYERIGAGLGLEELNISRAVLKNRLDAGAWKDTNGGIINTDLMDRTEKELVQLFSGYKLVFIDSLKKTSEADENSGKIEPVLKTLKKVSEKAKCAIILIHHKGKAKDGDIKQTGRGHSSIYDSVDIQIDLTDEGNETISLTCKKMRDGKKFDGLRYRFFDHGEFNKEQNCTEELKFEFIEDIASLKNKVSSLEIKLLDYLNVHGQTIQSKLLDELECGRTSFEEAASQLKEKELIREERGSKNSKIFSITENGISHLGWSSEEK